MTYYVDFDAGFAAGKRAGMAINKLAIERRDEIIANQAKTIDELREQLVTSVTKLAQENAALSARLGELAMASPKPIIGAYPIKPLGKNLKPHQPEPAALPKVGDKVRLVPKGATESQSYWKTKLFVVSAVYDSGINVTVVSRTSGRTYNLNDYTWEVQ